MRIHQASQKKSSTQKTKSVTPNPLESRPFAVQATHEETARSPETKGYESAMPSFAILNPEGGRAMPLAPKLAIGAPGDKYEQEADRVASQVVKQINSPDAAKSSQGHSLQRMEAPVEELQAKPRISDLQRSPLPLVQREVMRQGEYLQAKSNLQRGSALGEASRDLESAINSARGSGQPLDVGLQRLMGQAMGADFSGVKVHTDAQADQLNQSIQAKAFTTGQDIFFRQGAYDPGSRGGQELLAHELTHVIQQNGSAIQSKSDIAQRTPETVTLKSFEEEISNSFKIDQNLDLGLSYAQENEPVHVPEEGQQNQQSQKPNKRKKTNKLKEKYTEFQGTPEKFFGHLVPSVLDLMVPDTGDKGKLEVQLRFPVHPGIFVGGRVLLSSERKEDKELKVNFEGTFQAGGTAAVAAIAGEVGAYFESVGRDSKSVGTQLNYGLYRRFRESHVMPRQFTNKLWGDISSKKGYEQAENWAAQVEKAVFGEKDEKGKFTDAAKKSYIETGGMGGVLADINAGNIATAKASGQYYEGRRFDQYALDQIKGDRDPNTNKIKQGSGVGTTDYVPVIGAQKTKGQGAHRFVLSTSGTFGNLSGGIKLKYDAVSKPGSKWTEAGTNKWEVEVEQKTNLPPSVIAQGGLAAKIATPLGVGLVDLARSFAPEIAKKLPGEEKDSTFKKLFKNKKKTNSQIAGEITRPLIDIGMQLQQNIPATGAAFQAARQGTPLLDKTAISFVGSLGIGLNVKLGQEAKPDDQPTLESIKGEGAIYKISTPTVRFADSQITLFELGKRLMQFKYQQAKKMKLEVVGIQAERAFGDQKDQDGNVIGKEWGDWQLK